MNSIDTIYYAYVYIIPAIAGALFITALSALLGWQQERKKNAEMIAIIAEMGKLMKLNNELRAECDGFKRDMEKLADKWEGK